MPGTICHNFAIKANLDMREEPHNFSEMMQDPNLQGGDICRDFLRNVLKTDEHNLLQLHSFSLIS